jgi:putative nucleotidyltransferase with HDIG domain
MTRDEALALVREWTQSESLVCHMLAVEAAMAAYARHFGEDEARWAVCGLLHDFDYERYPNAAQAADAEHPAEGVRHLRAMGVDEEICTAILGHAHYTGVARESLMAKALFAVDELCGLVMATALVRPSRSLNDVEVASVKKKLKDKAFARGVDRADITNGAAALGVDLDAHISLVVGAMRAVGPSLGLAGTPPA